MAVIIDATTGIDKVQDNVIVTNDIVNGAVTADKLASGAVTDGKLSLTANSAPIKTAVNASGDAPIYACRAWVNFNGTGTVAIRASGNVSSITDNGVGDYTVNFTTAMPDANYSISGMVQDSDESVDTSVVGIQNPGGLTSSGARLRTTYGAGSIFDFPVICVAIFR